MDWYIKMQFWLYNNSPDNLRSEKKLKNTVNPIKKKKTGTIQTTYSKQ